MVKAYVLLAAIIVLALAITKLNPAGLAPYHCTYSCAEHLAELIRALRLTDEEIESFEFEEGIETFHNVRALADAQYTKLLAGLVKWLEDEDDDAECPMTSSVVLSYINDALGTKDKEGEV